MEDKRKEAAGTFLTINSQPVKARKQLALILHTTHKTQGTVDHRAVPRSLASHWINDDHFKGSWPAQINGGGLWAVSIAELM